MVTLYQEQKTYYKLHDSANYPSGAQHPDKGHALFVLRTKLLGDSSNQRIKNQPEWTLLS